MARRRHRRRPIVPGLIGLGAVLVLAAGSAAGGPGARAAAPADEPSFEEQVLFAPVAGYTCFRIPVIVQAVDGTLLAFAEGRVNTCGDTGDIDLVLKRSTDGGRTWGPLEVIIEGNGETRGNPTPVVDRESGRIALLSMRNPGHDWTPRTPYLQYSEDNGVTWSEPRDISAEVSRPEWSYWYATGPVHGIQLERGPHAGRLVAPVYFSPPSNSNRGNGLVYSDDGGLTWELGAVDLQPTEVAGESTIVELSDGRIYVSTRGGPREYDYPDHRGYAVSSDGGATFDAPVTQEPQLPMPINQASLLRLSATDEGDDSNRILFASPAHPAAREVMTIRSSFDEGETWETWDEGKVVHWAATSYSDMVEIDDGVVGLLYEAGGFSPYETIRFARFDEAYLDTPNDTPPGIPDPPAPGPTTPDVTRSRNEAYVRGGAALTEGRFGSALAFDGIDDHVELPLTEALDLAADDFTWATWFRYSATSGNHSLMWAHKIGPGTTPAVWLRAEPGSNRIRGSLGTGWSNPVTVSSPGAYNDGAWHHVVLQRSAGRLLLFIDGEQVAAVNAPYGSITEGGADFGIEGIHLGQRIDGVDRLRGALDETRIYRRALSLREIQLLARTNAPPTGALELRLPFEQIVPTDD